MQNSTLILAGLAALGLGVLGGLVADPVMLATPESDWRERYRSASPAPSQSADALVVPHSPSFGGEWSGYTYGLASLARQAEQAAGAAPVPDVSPVPMLERSVPAAPWARELQPEPATAPEGAAAVADALARTEGIGPATNSDAAPVPVDAETSPAAAAAVTSPPQVPILAADNFLKAGVGKTARGD